jgi:hypothetical protein
MCYPFVGHFVEDFLARTTEIYLVAVGGEHLCYREADIHLAIGNEDNAVTEAENSGGLEVWCRGREDG